MGERYLLQHGQGWTFRIAGPAAIRGRFKSRNVTVGLHTQDPAKAKRMRDELLPVWQARFERARQGAPLTLVEIAAEGQEAHDFLLDRLAADSARGRYDGAPIIGPDGEVSLTYEEHTIGAHLDVIREALAEDGARCRLRLRPSNAAKA